MDRNGETLHGMVRAEFEQFGSPEKAAVIFDDGSTRTELSYEKIFEISRSVAEILRRELLESSEVIGLCGVTCPFSIPLLLGILEAPAAYRPIDPESSSAEFNRSVDCVAINYILTQDTLEYRFETGVFVRVETDKPLPGSWMLLKRTSRVNIWSPVPNSPPLAYVLTTSGTTGHPKIVRVPHQCIVPNINDFKRIFFVSGNDVIFQAASLTFDPSVVEIFLSLVSGATLVMAPPQIKISPQRLADVLLNRNHVTILQITPSLLTRFPPELIRGSLFSPDSPLRIVMLGGEPCPTPTTLSQLVPDRSRVRIFNVYGITEVSCWASCCEVDYRGGSDSVTLGYPLSDTELVLKGEEGVVVEEGVGVLNIGGEQRVCFLDDEVELAPNTLRRSGDVVRRAGDVFRYIGRSDNVFKKMGKKFYLDEFEHVMAGVDGVKRAVMVADGTQNGVSAFIETEDPLPADKWPYLRREIVNTLLSQFSIRPDKVTLVDSLPVTRHGKVDKRQLLKHSQSDVPIPSLSERPRVEACRLKLQRIWQDVLMCSEVVDDSSNFLSAGGNSLKAIATADLISEEFHIPSSRVIDYIINKSFSDLLNHIVTSRDVGMTSQGLGGGDGTMEDNLLTPAGASETKRRKLSTKTIVSVRRGNVLDCSKEDFPDFENLFEVPPPESQFPTLVLELDWKVDLYKCIDASPLVIFGPDMGDSVVYIGGHSHVIAAVSLTTGREIWVTELPDRVESSACVSPCKEYIVVGCYDGCVYTLARDTGTIHWSFQTGEMVKSSPCPDQRRRLVYIGSHDRHLYALNVEDKTLMWKVECGGGSITSSPVLSSDADHIYTTTLNGTVFCLNADSGAIVWQFSCPKPIFSSPCCPEGDGVLVGCVDGCVYHISDAGDLVYKFKTEGAVFSSPALASRLDPTELVVFGCHDHHLYCIGHTDRGTLRWKLGSNSTIYSTPFPTTIPSPHNAGPEIEHPCLRSCCGDAQHVARGRGLDVVVSCSTSGRIVVVCLNCGGELGDGITLEGEVFSSPVALANKIVVGCRNNFLHCFKMKWVWK